MEMKTTSKKERKYTTKKMNTKWRLMFDGVEAMKTRKERK